jgi:formate dehydrogenase subunit gamma
VSYRVQRFTASERGVHWLTAAAFFSLLFSGLVVGKRGTLHNVMYAWHLASAVSLVAGVALIALAGNRRALVRTAGQLSTLDAEDRRWLASASSRLLAGTQEPPAGRFNAGQKVNFLLVCILLAALYITGGDTILAGTHHNLIFGAHKLATISVCVLVAGHLYMALVNHATRPALRGMLTGEVDREWGARALPPMGALELALGRSPS